MSLTMINSLSSTQGDYSKEAHEHLASHGFAPMLRQCVSGLCCGLQLSWIDLNTQCSMAKTLERGQEKVRRSEPWVQTLHEGGGLVHGDIRMVTSC